MKRSLSRALVALLLLAAVPGLMAGTTGSIYGTVSDSNGDSLPGVTILLQSPQLIGTRSTVTDAEGKFRLVFLPPGTYKVTGTFTGFRTSQSTVKVEIDGNHQVNMTMEVANSVEETMVVTNDLPVIDQVSTESGGNFSDEFFTKVPTGRSVASIMTLAPGVSTQDVDGSYRINGASGPENQYIIDGVNTTGIELGNQSANLNFDFIQEVQIKTGGYNAEFGRATGGILNVITKSGGNEFEGSVYAFNDNRDNVASARQIGVDGSTDLGTSRSDYGFTVGGPIIKDRLWFFAGINPIKRKDYALTPEARLSDNGGRTDTFASLRGENETVDLEQDIVSWAAKLTWQLNESNTITLSGNGDPQDQWVRDETGPLTRDRKYELESQNLILKWNSILSNVFTLDVNYSLHEESQVDGAADGGNTSRIFNLNTSPAEDFGGLGFTQNYEATRDDFNVKVGAYLGDHDIKFGFQYEETEFSNSADYSGLGNVAVDYDENEIRVRTYAGVDAQGNLFVLDSQDSTTNNEYHSYFVQDSWSVTPNLVLNLGLRNEVQKLLDANGNTYHSFDDNLSPRLGFTWDFTDSGRSKLYGHWGRFYQSLPMDINNRAAAPEILWFRWYSMDAQTPTSILDWNEAEVARLMTPANDNGSGGFGSGSTAIDPNAKATNHDEIILGIEYEFKTDWTVGFRYVNRSINDVIEDISFDAGDNYIIGNPGSDVTFTNTLDETMTFYDYLGNQVSVAPGATHTLSAEQVGFPKVVRDYNGYEFLLRKAYRDDYQFQFSYVHSSTRGNYIGSALPDGQVDPGITSMFDILSTTVNGNGLLPQHRRHQLKFDGSYEFDFGLLAGLSYRYTSGAGYDAIGDPDVGNGAYGEFQLLPRGSAGTLPAITSLDLHLDYTMKFSGKMNLSLYADVFNIFDFQEATAVSNQFSYDAPGEDLIRDPNAEWNAGQSAINTGDDHTDAVLYANRFYGWIEGQFSNVNELTDWYTTNGLSTEEDFGKPTNFQLGRRTRFGMRFRF